VHWLQSALGAEILWVDPYPTRFPRIRDLANLRRDIVGRAKPKTGDLKVVSPPWLPIEPLPGSIRLLGLLWRKSYRSLKAFVDPATVIVIAKPSHLASDILKRFPSNFVVFDVMDNFPAFYKGLAKKVMRKNLIDTLRRADFVSFSSTPLQTKYGALAVDSCVVLNAYDPSSLLKHNSQSPTNQKDPRKILGYVGTIAEWFDWDLVREIAVANPDLIVRLIGPVYNEAPFPLPNNIEISGIRSHDQAMAEMHEFDAGLIPFKVNELTEFVDPIKYYEYRAAGLLVFTTDFGEMRSKLPEGGIILISQLTSLGQISQIFNSPPRRLEEMSDVPCWNSRFSNSTLLSVLAQHV
jgi:hypothetical protein